VEDVDNGASQHPNSLYVTIGSSADSHVHFPVPTDPRKPPVVREHHCSVRWNVSDSQFVLDNVCPAMVSTFVQLTSPAALQHWSWLLIGDVLRPNNARAMAAAALRLVPQARCVAVLLRVLVPTGLGIVFFFWPPPSGEVLTRV